MSANSQVKFFAQSLYLLDVFAVNQLPSNLKVSSLNKFLFSTINSSALQVQIDADKFLSAFSYMDENGQRVSLEPWKYAPRANGQKY